MLESLAKRKIRKEWSQMAPCGHRFISYSDTSGLLILAEGNSITGLIPAFNELREDGKHITLIVYNPSLDFEEKKIPVDHLLVMTSKDLNKLRNFPVSSFLNKFKGIDTFPVLLDLTVDTVCPLLYLVVISSSCFKMGLRKPGEIEPYDFMIQENKIITPVELFQNLLFYWKKIGIKNINL